MAVVRTNSGRVRLDAAALRRIRDIRSIANYQRWLPKLLIIVGSGLLVYVGTSYAQMLLEQRQLASEFQREQSPKARRVSIDADVSRLRVPKIDLDSYIVEGVSRHAMSLGIGHMRDTVEPGEAGNAVLSAHRDTFFRHVHELEKGDTVLVDRGGKTYVFMVTGKDIVDPDDVAVIQRSKDARLTLITCYPTYYIGPAPKRLVIFAKMVGAADMNTADAHTPRSSARGAAN